MAMPTEKLLSIIVPAYNEQDMISKTFHTVKDIMDQNNIPFELIFVDDGSRDMTYMQIATLANEFTEAKGLSFSRNFGKESAIFAGLEAAQGSCCVIMDCDLQHPPATIIEMYRLWEEGYEVVEGVKASRGK